MTADGVADPSFIALKISRGVECSVLKTAEVAVDPLLKPDVGAAREQPLAPLLVSNLLNGLSTLAELLLSELRRGSWLNAYLLATGMNQIVEDYLHPNPYHLRKASGYLARLRPPVGALASEAGRSAATTIARLRGSLLSVRHVAAWQKDWAHIVAGVADVAVQPVAVSIASREALVRSAESLVLSIGQFPAPLLGEILRIPSCFRSFDQQPADLQRIACEFTQRWPDRRRPLLVVGIRTSGSYLAPLYGSIFKALGFLSVRTLTMRPGRRLYQHERARLDAAAKSGGMALIADDPPVSGGTLAEAARDLEMAGISARSIVMLLQLFGSHESIPPLLRRYECVALPWRDWAVHTALAAEQVGTTMAGLFGPNCIVSTVERIDLPSSQPVRAHVHALYHIQIVDPGSGASREQDVYVTGVGLGYFGDHTLAVAQAMSSFVPEVYGVNAGLSYRLWVPEERRLLLDTSDRQHAAAEAVGDYVRMRHRALQVDSDVSLGLTDRLPVWEAASNLLSQTFGRAWAPARIAGVDSIVRRLLQTREHSIVDGSMTASSWFAAEDNPRRLLKVDFDERAFSNRDLACFDPAYDLASMAASFDLYWSGQKRPDPVLPRLLREAGEDLSGEPIRPERWLLYQLVHLWSVRRCKADQTPAVLRASARAMQRYFAETYFARVPEPTAGPLCAIDIDGVLECSPLGFPCLTPASAATLRALILHRYRPILATGRSLEEVRERCAAYRLAGGVAEYGAVIYNHASGAVRDLRSAGEREDLGKLRMALGAQTGTYLDGDHQYSIRAYRLDTAGRKCGLSPEMAADMLRRVGVNGRVRAIAGQAQTDFMVAGVDKGTGLQSLAAELDASGGDGRGKLLAMAVGDTVSDLAMFALANLALAPASADAQVRSSGVNVVGRPYQRGLALASAKLLGHEPGHCAVCSGPRPSPDARRLLAILGAQESGTLGMALQAMELTAGICGMEVRSWPPRWFSKPRRCRA